MTRRRWVYVEGQAMEVAADYEQPTAATQVPVLNDRHYDGLRATDGADISTRRKHREYMKRHGLTTMDDFTQTWKKEAGEREKRFAGHDPSRKRDFAEAVEKLRSGYKPTLRRE